MFRDLLVFAESVLYYWVLLMTGGFITAILTFIEAYRGISFPWALSKWVFALFLSMAFFLSWRREHQAKIDAERKSKEKRPRIFVELMIQNDDGSEDNDYAHLLKITNHGDALATKIRLYYTVESKLEIMFNPEILDGVAVDSQGKICSVTVALTQQTPDVFYARKFSSLQGFMKENDISSLSIYCEYYDLDGKKFIDKFTVANEFYNLTILHDNNYEEPTNL